MYQLIVIGGGIAGAAAALRAAQYQVKTLWVLGDCKTAKKSRARWVKNVDNMIGVHPGIVLKHLENQFKEDESVLEKLKDLELHISTQDIVDNVKERLQDYSEFVTLVEAKALDAKKTEHGFEVVLDHEETPKVSSEFLIVGTGLMDVQPHIAKTKNEKLMEKTAWIYPFANDETVLYCIRCEGHLTRKNKTAIIGSSEVTGQVAIMLAERYNTITHILTNGEELKVEAETQKLLDHYKIKTITDKITDIQNKDGARGQLKAFEFSSGDVLPMDFAFVSMGIFEVYNELPRKLGAKLQDGTQEDSKKRVIIDARGETAVENLFCVGDMAVREDEPVMMQIYTAQEYAVRAVDTVDRRIRREKRDQILKS